MPGRHAKKGYRIVTSDNERYFVWATRLREAAVKLFGKDNLDWLWHDDPATALIPDSLLYEGNYHARYARTRAAPSKYVLVYQTHDPDFTDGDGI